MSLQCIDLGSGEVWLPECSVPIRPLMPMQEFLDSFSALGAVEGGHCSDDKVINSTGGFGRTMRLGTLPFFVSCIFRGHRQSAKPRPLIYLQLIPVGADWRRGSGFLWKIRQFFGMRSTYPTPVAFGTLDAQRAIYENWLYETLGQGNPRQAYPWGRISLEDWRRESWYINIEFFG